MTLEECALYYRISIYLRPEDMLWYWSLVRYEDHKLKHSGSGYYNPNNAKLALIEYIKNLTNKKDNDSRRMAKQ